MSKHVVIVGGGLSGLAAGVDLVSRGIRVTILEQKPALGGRAFSFKDSVTGDTIDNGQHVLIAGYERTMRFLEKIGTREMLRVQRAPSLLFHHPQRGFQEFRLPLLPTPFNLLVGILRCHLFSFLDRLRLLRAGLSLRSVDEVKEKSLATMTILEWLKSAGQSDEVIRSLWEPLAVSMMNERIHKASAHVFVQALRKAFLGGSRNAALAIPTVGLSELYVDGARRFITLRGGELRLNADAIEVMADDEHATGVRLRDGTSVAGDAVILTIPPNKLLPLLPSRLIEQFSYLDSFEFTPIVSVHMWFTEEFMQHEFVGLIGRRVQWLFNKRKINDETGKGAHVSAVISGANEFVGMTKEELVNIAVEDIRSLYDGLQEEPRHAVVVREKSATYSSSPGIEAQRPSSRTGITNLFLAGDWVATGYPATIEGAIVSAERAAQLAVSSISSGIAQ
ncbi:MAG: hydroxysqualene dehydroxylase HpnE [Bacteroidota bacterium]